MEVLPLESSADREYAAWRHHLARQGTPIGPNDLLIVVRIVKRFAGISKLFGKPRRIA